MTLWLSPSVDQLNFALFNCYFCFIIVPFVEYCRVYYWERELYPNGDIIKSEKKYYELRDLSYVELEVNGEMKYRAELKVLTGFVNNLGNPYIINPARDTISNLNILPLDIENGYQLHMRTRPLNNL